VIWRLILKPGQSKPVKIPYNPVTGRAASTADLTTWGTFEQAVAAYQRGGYLGLGFVFSEADPFCGIDLDHVRDAVTGELIPEAVDILKELDSYTEVSPSGTGVHVIIEGKMPVGAWKKSTLPWGVVEMYDQKRYFTVTGHLLEDLL
jgi:primase-polymerase (primpol)-like protein